MSVGLGRGSCRGFSDVRVGQNGAWAGAFIDGLTSYQRGDYPDPAKLFQIAATQGDAQAQFSLGLIYAEGNGVVQDRADAMKWYRLAAAAGEPIGTIGRMYNEGLGVPRDPAEAATWYQLW